MSPRASLPACFAHDNNRPNHNSKQACGCCCRSSLLVKFVFLAISLLQLAPPTTTIIQVSAAATTTISHRRRKLAGGGQTFGDYQTRTSVSDHAAIAYDQAEIVSLLKTPNEVAISAAREVYERGGNSKSYAIIRLVSSSLSDVVQKGTVMTGSSTNNGNNGTIVAGTAFTGIDSGANQFKFQYDVGQALTDRVNCRVGGLPASAQNVTGCLASSGNVTIHADIIDSNGGGGGGGGGDGQVGGATGVGGYATHEYTYDPTADNQNARTLRGFTTQAGAKMKGFEDFEAFKAYYGYDDYADRWIRAAFEGGRTVLENGVVDWSAIGGDAVDGRKEAIQKATVFMSVAMYVIFELEDAITDCRAGCETAECNAGSVNALDEGVAFYYGSTWAEDQGGHLLYALAQARCKNFATCGPSGDKLAGTAKANLDITAEMKAMKVHLNVGECSAAAENKNRIVNAIKVPLIQGVLRYAYLTDATKGNDWTERREAEGATFTASVLGWLAKCSPADAETVYSNMRVGQGGTANLAEVKKALENQYDCMGVSCAAVGGLVDVDDSSSGSSGVIRYLPGASPCTFATVADSAAAAPSLSVGHGAGTTTAFISMVVFVFISFL